MAVEPDAVLMQDGAEELCAEARNLALGRHFPTEHVSSAGHYYNHCPIGETNTQGLDYSGNVFQVWERGSI